MNTILTDDEIIDVIRKAGLRVIGPHKSLSRAVEAAVLAKLARQEPVAEVIQLDGEKIIDASMWFFDKHPIGTKLYAAPVAQQAEANTGNTRNSGDLQEARRLAERADRIAKVLEGNETVPTMRVIEFMREAGPLLREFSAAPEAPAPQPLTDEQRDAALNVLCRMFSNSEEVEGPDGMAMLVPLDLWHEAQEALDELIGEDGDERASGITKGDA